MKDYQVTLFLSDGSTREMSGETMKEALEYIQAAHDRYILDILEVKIVVREF
jgi:hypothetical protein